MRRIPFVALLVAVVVVGLGVGAGYGAWQHGRNAAAPSVAAAASLATASTAQGASAAAGANAAARPTVGTVQKIAGKELTLQSLAGATTRVALADNTAVTQVETGTPADLTVGATVTVVGQKGDSSVTATAVEIGGSGTVAVAQIGPGGQGAQRGQGVGQGAQAGAAGAPAQVDVARLSGKVESVAADGFILATDAGQTKIVVPASARIQKVVPATAADIKEGATVQVTGEAGADGVVAAKSVLIMPAGQGAGQSRPGN